MSDRKRDTIWVNVNWKLRSSAHWLNDGDVPLELIEETWMIPLRMLQLAVGQELNDD